jgi:hypothetical protein
MCETTKYGFASFASEKIIFAKLLDRVLLAKSLWDSILQAKH